MPPLSEPVVKRTVVFIDGQNLFNAAKSAFGHSYPNYNPVALADRICAANGWTRTQIRFYTGMPGAAEDPGRHRFWTNKLVVLRRQGVHVYTRPLRYRDKITHWPGTVREASNSFARSSAACYKGARTFGDFFPPTAAAAP